MATVIGRHEEKIILQDALKSNRAELIVVYGRRRIGKTYLVGEVYKQHICFAFSGMHKSTYKNQLKNFNLALQNYFPKSKDANDWLGAFYQLEKYLNTLRGKKKKVVFIDEFPWLDTRKSGFLSAFDRFWNSYASKRSDLVVVVCGSAASYLIKNIIRNKGGLHNRLTHKIQLMPFNLHETEQFLKHKNIRLTRYDILQLYMSMGGVPHYLDKINRGESVAQAIDRLCFTKNGFLQQEFHQVFASLFDQHDNHESIIRTLANVRKGLTRNVLLKKSKINSGGTLTKTLAELEDSGFIEKYLPYKGNNDALYRLSDEYSLFYLKFIEHVKPSKQAHWMKMQTRQSYKAWLGFSFETVCFKHVEQIKAGLGIAGVNSVYGSWIEKKNDDGAQIDLLIDRDDRVINLCEMKFYHSPFVLDKKYVQEMAHKKNAFASVTKTRKALFVTFISTYGLLQNQYSKQHVQNQLTMEHLYINL